MTDIGQNIFVGRALPRPADPPRTRGLEAGTIGSRAAQDERVGTTAAPLLDDKGYGQELSALDFSKLIGGPLTACVKAQAQASFAAYVFLKDFGFTASEDGKASDPVYVEFKYDKPGLFGMPTKTTLRVPLITMLHVPFLRIEYCEVEFLAKITSTTSVAVDRTSFSLGQSNSSNSNSGSSEYSDSYDSNRTWWGQWDSKRKGNNEYTSTSSMMAVNSTQVNTKEGATVTKEYSIKVKVRAVSDQMPAGMEKVLNILEGQMQEDTGNKALMDKVLGGIGNAGPGGPTGGAGSVGGAATSGAGGGAAESGTN